MNVALKMQISAFVDGELPENESELLLRRLSQDAALRQQVAEYLAIGRMIRREPNMHGVNALRGRIAAALGEELQQQPAAAVTSGSRYTRPIAGFAIAASVAVLALFGLRQVDLPTTDGDGQGYTQIQADELADNRLLDEMRRAHAESSDAGSVDRLARFVTLELSDGKFVEVEPDSHVAEEHADTAEDDTDDDSELQQAE